MAHRRPHRLMENFAATAAPLIARVAGTLAADHDVVDIRAGLGYRGPTEVSRAPAARLADGMVITHRGEVFRLQLPNLWDSKSGKIPANAPSKVLVRSGERLRLGPRQQISGRDSPEYCAVQSGECLRGEDPDRIWRQVLTAMADALP
jgi:hypothetical protein